MPRSPSPAQAEASRANGRRSHGPATPEGKARSARNARTFGLRAAGTLIDDEDAEAFHMLQASIHDHFRPASPLEAALCTRMLAALWRAERAELLESEFWCRLPQNVRADAPQPMSIILTVDQDQRRHSLATILRYQAEAGNAFARALRNLSQLRSGKADPQPGQMFQPSDGERVHTNEPEDAAPIRAPANDHANEAENVPAAATCTNDPERAQAGVICTDTGAVLPWNEPEAAAVAAVCTNEPEDITAPSAPTNEPERTPADRDCTGEPEKVPAAEDRMDAVEAMSSTEPGLVPAATNCTNEPEPTPAARALAELAVLHRKIALRWPPALHATAEAFILEFGIDGRGPPAWAKDLPEGSRRAA